MAIGHRAAGRLAVVGLALAAAAGCGGGPKAHPVRGTVVFAGGDVKRLAGGHVELRSADNPALRASGEIQEDGSFELTTLHEGRPLRGVPEGAYAARVVPPGADEAAEEDEEDEDGAEDDDGRPRARPKRLKPGEVHPRFRDFKTSKLSFQVPAAGEITLNVSTK